MTQVQTKIFVNVVKAEMILVVVFCTVALIQAWLI